MFSRKKEEVVEAPRFRKKEVIDDSEWDKKKILITLGVLLLLLIGALEIKNNFLDKNEKVLGDAVRNKPVVVEKPNIEAPLDVSSEFSSTVNDIKRNIQGLDPEEVASSSPQIQKVLKDIEGIKGLPASQARDMCLKICSGI